MLQKVVFTLYGCSQSWDIIWVRYFCAFAFNKRLPRILNLSLSNGDWMTTKQTVQQINTQKNWVIQLPDCYIRCPYFSSCCISCAVTLKCAQHLHDKGPIKNKTNKQVHALSAEWTTTVSMAMVEMTRWLTFDASKESDSWEWIP